MSPRHQSLEDLFRNVLPPRPVPLRKRVFWRVVLALLAFPPSRALLLRLRGN
ncbi:MAG: hypothetical protein ABW136_09110 [Steroidobacteraceae bacterium]